jgi:small-conductance mechanosensitive channel
VQLLTETVNWYRQNSVEQQIAKDTSDLTFLGDDQRIGGQIVQLVFEFARQAELTAPRPAKPSAGAKNKTSENAAPNSAALAQFQSLVQAAQKADQDYQQAQAEVQTAARNLAAATPKKRAELEAALAAEQSELALRQARRDALRNMIDFVSGSSLSASGFSGLQTEIDSLARSVPGNLSSPPNGNPASSSLPPPTIATQPEPSSLWELASGLLRLSRKQQTLNRKVGATSDLMQVAKRTQAPLVAQMRALIKHGDALASTPDTTDPDALARQKQEFDFLTAQFKTESAVILPLSKQIILLDLYNKSLASWKDSVSAQSREEWRNLTVRLGILLIIIAFVITASRLTRRAVIRYVADGRRRYQFLLLESIFFWVAIALVLIFTFATQLGSVATFAGLLTAGIALALQNVIVSMVGYFFLIGKFGIRVGDRVQIQDVTGEVVDIGLVRLHLMELGGRGTDSQPTGRVAAFSNSIVFQPTGGIFKQIPGTSFAWHEITLTFTPDSYYQIIEKRMQEALDRAYKTYRDSMERQRRAMEMTLSSISASEILPRVRLHFTTAGIEVTVRFPVILDKATEIDDRVMGELLSAVEHEPGLSLLGTEMPTVKSDSAPEPADPAKTK